MTVQEVQDFHLRKSTHHGNRSIKYWKKKILRRYRRRAEKFRDEARTDEQKQAWDTVIEWFNSGLRLRFDDERVVWQNTLPRMKSPDGVSGVLEEEGETKP